MSVNKRLDRLEQAANPKEINKYMLATKEGKPSDSEGYKIQPFIPEFGGKGGEPFYLKTREEVEAFDARADVDLLWIDIVYVDSGGIR